MRTAFIIMAHKNPSQIQRLINRLGHPHFDLYIHLDLKTDMEDFSYLANYPQVHFIKNRIKVSWGAISFTEALLNSIKEIISKGEAYDFITLISGQDYVLKTSAEIYSYFDKRKGKNFLYLESLISPWWHEAIKRINRYDMVNFSFPGKYKLQILANTFLPAKRFPLPYILYGGPRAAWFTITVDCAKYVMNFIEQNPRVMNFFRYTWGADEFIFPTIIMNSEFKRTVVIDNDFLYVDWSQGGSNPKILTTEDFGSLERSCCYFARKFDNEIDANIFDLLDKSTEYHVPAQYRIEFRKVHC
jgi:hypothetical protein